MAETSMYSKDRPSTSGPVTSIRGNTMESSPPISPSSASIPSPMSSSSRQHSSSNGRIFAPLSPPPTAPLPALPLGQQLGNAVPLKPKLAPKRELSRSPSPIVSRTEQRQQYETRAARDELARARELARQHKMHIQQGEQQYGYALAGEDSDDGPAVAATSTTSARTSRAPSILSIHTSPAHKSSRQQRKAGDLSSSGLRFYEPPSPVSSFNSLDGPLLLNANAKRQQAKMHTTAAPKQMQRSSSHNLEGSVWSSSIQPGAAYNNDRSTPMTLSRSEARLQKRAQIPRRLQGGLYDASNDVEMRDAVGSNLDMDDEDDDDDDEDEDDDEYVPAAAALHQRPSAGDRQISTATTMMEPAESSWADDASVIDVNEQQHYPHIAPEEIFEVAALRRQVEQLQMALKKQMAAPAERPKDKSMLSPTRSTDRYPFGLPTPDASREGSSVSGGGGVAAFKTGASPSSSRSFREQHLSPSQFSSEQTSPSMFSSDRRSSSAAGASAASRHLFSNDYYPSDYPRNRITSEEMSSVVPEESASVAIVRDEDNKLEELSRKIQALEAMFKTSTLSSRAPSIAPSTATAGSSKTQFQQYQDSLSVQSARPRRASLVTISTFDGNTSASDRRSPAASAYNFNATNPFEFERPSLVTRQSSSSNNSVDQGARKGGVARFIMGVGTSKSNVPRDEHGNPLPSMQVSWSRKRNEKIAKPVTNAKMKVGPGRGRIVLQPKP